MSTTATERESTLELGVATFLTGIEVDTGGTPKRSFGIVRVTSDLQQQVADHGAVIAIRRVPGASERQRWQLIASEAIELYALDYGTAWQVANDVDDLLSQRRFNAGGYRIDATRNPSAFAPAPHPNLVALTSVWRLTTRSL